MEVKLVYSYNPLFWNLSPCLKWQFEKPWLKVNSKGIISLNEDDLENKLLVQ